MFQTVSCILYSNNKSAPQPTRDSGSFHLCIPVYGACSRCGPSGDCSIRLVHGAASLPPPHQRLLQVCSPIPSSLSRALPLLRSPPSHPLSSLSSHPSMISHPFLPSQPLPSVSAGAASNAPPSAFACPFLTTSHSSLMPLIQVRSPCLPHPSPPVLPCIQHLAMRYSTTAGDEVEDMEVLLRVVKKHLPAVQGVSVGAIASDYQREQVEHACLRLGPGPHSSSPPLPPIPSVHPISIHTHITAVQGVSVGAMASDYQGERVEHVCSRLVLPYSAPLLSPHSSLPHLISSPPHQLSAVQGVSVGEIASDYQRERVEHVCSRLGLTPLAYLWQRPQKALLDDMIAAGIHAILIKVAALGLRPEKHLGMRLEEIRGTMHALAGEQSGGAVGGGARHHVCPGWETNGAARRGAISTAALRERERGKGDVGKRDGGKGDGERGGVGQRGEQMKGQWRVIEKQGEAKGGVQERIEVATVHIMLFSPNPPHARIVVGSSHIMLHSPDPVIPVGVGASHMRARIVVDRSYMRARIVVDRSYMRAHIVVDRSYMRARIVVDRSYMRARIVHARIVVDSSHIILHSPDPVAPVGVLRITAFHVAPKTQDGAAAPADAADVALPSPVIIDANDEDALSEDSTGTTVGAAGGATTGTGAAAGEGNRGLDGVQVAQAGEGRGGDVVQVPVAVQWHGFAFIACDTQGHDAEGRGDAAEDKHDNLASHLSIALSSISHTLHSLSLSWAHALYVHLYLADMAQFGAANSAYVRHITEAECVDGVPSRSTVELPLGASSLGGSGGSSTEGVLLLGTLLHRPLQPARATRRSPVDGGAIGSGPANHGAGGGRGEETGREGAEELRERDIFAPPSAFFPLPPLPQSTSFKGVLWMAGQLGLDPPFMELVGGGATQQAERALSSYDESMSPISRFSSLVQCTSFIFEVPQKSSMFPLPLFFSLPEHELQGSPVDGGAIGTSFKGVLWMAGQLGLHPPIMDGAGGGRGEETSRQRGRQGAEELTSFKGVLWMAGQLGLDPPIMELVEGGARRQAERALRSCEAVAAVVKGRDGAGVVGGERKEVARAVEEFFAAARRERREIRAAVRSGKKRREETGEGQGEEGTGEKGGGGGEGEVEGRGEGKREGEWGVGRWWVVGHGGEEGVDKKEGKESAAGAGDGTVGASGAVAGEGEGREEEEEEEEGGEGDEEDREEQGSEGVIAADARLQFVVVPGLPKGYVRALAGPLLGPCWGKNVVQQEESAGVIAADPLLQYAVVPGLRASVEIAPLLAAPFLSYSSATSAAPWPSSLTPLHLPSTSAPCHVSNTDGHTSVLGNQLAGMSLGEEKEGVESAAADKETGAKEVDRILGDMAEEGRQRGAEVTDSMAEGAAGRSEGDEGEMQGRVAVGGRAEGVSIAGQATAAAGAFCRVHLWVEQARGEETEAEQGRECEAHHSLAHGVEAAGSAGGEGQARESLADSFVDGVAGGCVSMLSDALRVARLDWPDVAERKSHAALLALVTPLPPRTPSSTPQMLRAYVPVGGPIPIPALSLALKAHLSKTLHNRTQSQPSNETPAPSHHHGPSAAAAAAAAVAVAPCPIVVPVTAVGPTAAADALLAVELTAFGA
ncbi:unnamed protein product [Closterium sp. Naga37s-1]|nr:unnamed protein product [Closterium sp. Naga37s-1]